MDLLNIDWHELFIPGRSVLEMFIRGTLVYLVLFFMMRVLLKREAGNIGLPDILMMVLIADAAQNAMSSDYKSITEGIVLVITIVFWNYTLDWMGHRFPALQRIVHPPPLLLVRDGRMLRKNMEDELITEEELMTQLREQGVDEISKVKEARLEGDGHISVIKKRSSS
jgi:uncharacterized membrane protein YcaP (DUF421 family)